MVKSEHLENEFLSHVANNSGSLLDAFNFNDYFRFSFFAIKI